jgi:hypothetical protein
MNDYIIFKCNETKNEIIEAVNLSFYLLAATLNK